MGYNEDQKALVILDPTDFGSWVSVILGSLTINWIINMIKESGIEELSVSLNGSRISHLLPCHQAVLSVGSEIAANQIMGLINLNEVVKTIRKEEINTFSSKIIHAQTKIILLGSNMHVMIQTLEEGEEPCLHHGLSIMNTYTKMMTGSKWAAVMVKNLTTALVSTTKGVELWLQIQYPK